MELTPYQQDVISGNICPYCKSKTKIAQEETVYGRRYKGRSVIICGNYPYCDAYVGTHDNGEALGRLADKSLRQYKKVAHDWFDKLWREMNIDRNECYLWLSEELNLPLKYTHIGMFSIKTCKKLISIFNKKDLKQIQQDIQFVVDEYKGLADYESMRQDNLWK